MAYEDSDYPGAIDTFRTQENIPGQTFDNTKSTTIFAEDFEKLQNAVLALENSLGADLKNIYPVGSVYINANDDTSPATLLGFGTWSPIGAGRVLVGQDIADTDFDTLEETGGEKEVTLSVAQMPSHTHSTSLFYTAGSTGSANYSATGPVLNKTARNTEATGGDESHNNLQPYLVVKMWVRTA